MYGIEIAARLKERFEREGVSSTGRFGEKRVGRKGAEADVEWILEGRMEEETKSVG